MRMNKDSSEALEFCSKVIPKCSSAPVTPSCPPKSCFYDKDSRRHSTQRFVTFPEETTQLVSHVEPYSPWNNAPQINQNDVIHAYKDACLLQKCKVLQKVIKQLEELAPTKQRVIELDVHGESVDAHQCEALEEVFKRIQFHSLNFESTNLNDESAIALFDMIEYYDSAVELAVGYNHIGPLGWQACARMLRNCPCLEALNLRGTDLSEGNMMSLSRALKLGAAVTVLHLENCNLSGNSCKSLVSALKLNTRLTELYLSDNKLNHADAVQLCSLLMSNISLKCLDLRNNNIGDGGVSYICDGLCNQPTSLGGGLTTLVLWNNNITSQSSRNIQRALVNSSSLEVLNLGMNQLTNETIIPMKEALQQNKHLLQLGLQATKLTCEGAVAIAECLVENSTLTRIDLRENMMQVAGLMALSHTMKVNSTLIRLDLDPIPKNEKGHVKEIQMQYMEYLLDITKMCDQNKESQEKSVKLQQEEKNKEKLQLNLNGSTSSSKATRKVSLTCEVSPVYGSNDITVKNPPSPPRSRHVPHNYENESDSDDEQNEINCGYSTSVDIPNIIVSPVIDDETPRRKLRSPSPTPVPSPSLLDFEVKLNNSKPSVAATALLALFDRNSVDENENVGNSNSNKSPRPQRSSAPENLCPSPATKPTVVTRKSRFSVTQVIDTDYQYSSSAPTAGANAFPKSRFSITPVMSEESLTSPTIVVPKNTKPIIGFEIQSDMSEKRSESLNNLNISDNVKSKPISTDAESLCPKSELSSSKNSCNDKNEPIPNAISLVTPLSCETEVLKKSTSPVEPTSNPNSDSNTNLINSSGSSLPVWKNSDQKLHLIAEIDSNGALNCENGFDLVSPNPSNFTVTVMCHSNATANPEASNSNPVSSDFGKVNEPVAKHKLIASCLSSCSGDSGIESEESLFEEIGNNVITNGISGKKSVSNTNLLSVAESEILQNHEDQLG